MPKKRIPKDLERGLALNFFDYDKDQDLWSLSRNLARGLQTAKENNVSLESYAILTVMFGIGPCTRKDFESFVNLIVFLGNYGSVHSNSFSSYHPIYET